MTTIRHKLNEVIVYISVVKNVKLSYFLNLFKLYTFKSISFGQIHLPNGHGYANLWKTLDWMNIDSFNAVNFSCADVEIFG